VNFAPRRINLGFDRFSGVYLFALFIVIFSIWEPSTFPTSSTFHSVASQQAVAAMVALAVLVPIAAGHYDLSVGANANLAGLVADLLIVQLHWNIAAAILAAVAVGVLTGAVNAFVIVRLHVSSFIATLAMGSILSAVLLIATANQLPNPPNSNAWNDLTQWTVGGIQIIVLYLVVLAVILWWVLERTPAGRYIYATGGNPDAARLSGVSVERWTWIPMIASGGIAGLAGVLFTSQNGPSLSFGAALLLPAFAALFLGSTQLKPGRFNVWGTLLAIYVLATGVEGLQLLSGQVWLPDMFNGIAVILAVALAVNRQRRISGGASKRRASVSVPTEVRSLNGQAPAYAEPREGLAPFEDDLDRSHLRE
jgi:ribose transport system permease protein